VLHAYPQLLLPKKGTPRAMVALAALLPWSRASTWTCITSPVINCEEGPPYACLYCHYQSYHITCKQLNLEGVWDNV
jgi:hypothetical protein